MNRGVRLRIALPLTLLFASAATSMAAGSIHPPMPLLDAQGQSVADSGRPLSLAQSCGACHDTEWIATHNYHAQLGFDESAPATSGRAFDVASGLLGRWDPLLYDRIGRDEDDASALSPVDWLREHGGLHVGGGRVAEADPALDGYELDCFLCHLEKPAKEQRDFELREGRFEWASTATLARTEVVRHVNGEWQWQREAFDEMGRVDASHLPLSTPSNGNCGQCHGLVRDLGESALFSYRPDASLRASETTGVVIAPTRLHRSGVNLAGREKMTRAWDVHAERLVQCVDCHFSTNNPLQKRANEQTGPAHLRVDPRQITLADYLKRPSHDLAKGHAAQGTIRQDLDGSMRRCEDCHDAGAAHDWLPYKERHLQGLLCESCHVPRVEGPARSVTDWTAPAPDGNPRVEYRGVEGNPNNPASLVVGYEPVLLAREDGAPHPRLAPHNLMSTWYWFDDVAKVPVSRAQLMGAWYPEGEIDPTLVAALDLDANSRVDARERVLIRENAVAAVRARLKAMGVADPQIRAELQPFGTHHGVAPKSDALRDCQSCHGTRSRLAEPFLLASVMPGGVRPTLVGDAGIELHGQIETGADGSLFYRPMPDRAGLYLLGFERTRTVDLIGKWALWLVVAGVVLHGGLRLVLASARRAQNAATPSAAKEGS